MAFTDEELGHYRQMVAMIIDNDPVKKKRVDTMARLQLATVKQAFPDATDDTVVTFLASVAVVLARLLATPMGEIAEIARGVFDNNMVAAAHVMGAYDIDGDFIPQQEDQGETAPDTSTTEFANRNTGLYL
jgi:hypothetical protein